MTQDEKALIWRKYMLSILHGASQQHTAQRMDLKEKFACAKFLADSATSTEIAIREEKR